MGTLVDDDEKKATPRILKRIVRAITPRKLRGSGWERDLRETTRSPAQFDPEPATPEEKAERCFRVVFAMNAMWCTAWIGLVLTNSESSVAGLDFIFGVAPPVIIAMDFRFRQNSLSSPHFKKPVVRNPKRDELVRKLSWMWLPKRILSELLFLAVVTAQWIGGFVAHSAADRLRVSMNGAALFMLFVVWRYLRRANRETGQLLQAEIDKLDQAEAQ